MSTPYAMHSLATLKTGQHLCCFFESDAEHQVIHVSYLGEGLKNNQKVLYLYDADCTEKLIGQLISAGIDADAFVKKGQLQIGSAKIAFTRNGVFKPEDALAFLWRETQKALAEGYSSLRISCEVSWIQHDIRGGERLFEFEGKVNAFIPGSWCLLLCQYDRRRFKSVDLLEALTTHPTVAAGTEIFENFYYVPRDDESGESDTLAATLHYRLENLAKRRELEETLRERERKYRSIFEGSVEGIFQTSVEGHYLSVNPALARIYGYESPTELIQSVKNIALQIYVDPSRRDEFVRLMLENETVIGFESQIFKKDRSVIWISENVRAVHGANGKLIHFEGTVQDITERKRQAQRVIAQQAATRVLTQAQALAEAAPLLLKSICESLEWELGVLWTVDNEAGCLRCVESWCSPAIDVAEFVAFTKQITFENGIGLPGRVWAKAEPAWITDVVHDKNFPRAPLARAAGLHGAFAFPIINRHSVLGVLEFITRQIYTPDEDLLKMMATLGTQVGQLIERRRLENELLQTKAALSEAMNKPSQ